MAEEKPYVVYCLQCIDSQKTYVGCTNDLKRRLRQHNCEIVGGAKATRGRKWRYHFIVKGFRNKIEALQFEWRMHHPIPRSKYAYRGPQGRINALDKTMMLERWTSKSPLSFDVPLEVEYTFSNLKQI